MQQFIAKRWFITFLILLSLTFGLNAAFAETEKNIEIFQMGIQVMPEYDTPDILIIYSVHFKNTSNQPNSGELVWNVPKGSKNHIVVDKSAGDNHVQPTVKAGGENDQIVWKFPTPLQPGEVKPVQIEYYYNNLQGNPDKNFLYEYIPVYPVTQAEVGVYQPLKASNFVITPDFGQPQSGGDGFSVYKKEFRNLKPGDKIEIKASYTKSDPNPSVAPLSQQQDQGGQPAGQPPQSKRTSSVTVLLFFAAFVAVIGFIIYKAMYSKHVPADQDIEEEDDEDDEDESIINTKTKMKKRNLNKKQQSIGNSKLQAEKKKLRNALLGGRISEETYHELLAELNDEEDS